MSSPSDSIYYGVKAPEKYQLLLRSWIRALREYRRQLVSKQEGDHGWFYNERANVGFLAAAAWLAGGVALEEYKWDKDHGEKISEIHRGRGDLYICLDGDEFHCEAKHEAVEFGDDYLENVESHLTKATEDATKTMCNDPNAYALLFILPYHKGEGQFTANERQDVVEKTKKIQSDAMAWHFPADGNKQLWIKEQNRNYSGVILLIKKAKSKPMSKTKV